MKYHVRIKLGEFTPEVLYVIDHAGLHFQFQLPHTISFAHQHKSLLLEKASITILLSHSSLESSHVKMWGYQVLSLGKRVPLGVSRIASCLLFPSFPSVLEISCQQDSQFT